MLPINDLARHNGPLDGEIRVAIDRVLQRGYYILGPENQAFEAEFAAYLGVAGCVAVGNGTDALELALRALHIGPGDEVVTVANAGMYAGTAIHAVGATPRYVDIDPASMLLDVSLLPAATNDKTRAIVVTHLYGRMADVEAVVAFARPRGIAVIEDCAQAHGARRNGKLAGSVGDLAAFSFYPTKNLGALGDGGAVVSSDAGLLARLRGLRQYGWTSKYHVGMAGGRNSRLDEIQAAILRCKLPHLDGWNARRRAIIARYNAGLSGLGWQLPPAPGEGDVGHLYVVRAPQRDAVRAALTAAGIASDVHYPVPDHQQAALPMQASLPVTEVAAAELLTLPCFPELTDAELDQVIAACRQTVQGGQP
ncbi:dTDP-4-amino-4,6-dideoxygalactose transaminase [Andreprevotia lacus DSM 23236]|jgi:dTDP-4-amino-4,6-dideoxygalactose transaminase|uniref:dTDP-4-amino-4,6-dideoxygalactose transaminase n=1 Tax=Andreprevotia lacus DSM 23236 TaxID=1121001 RepID=A0A1W1XI30_9NEIS|nr:DegT/DnrJ/EryC1/StrS family aminotransferase [Andreprevotia lacus]SMC23442.1 dTDP-4-amino-4,6-dideoxygalactose transaminase [Andreprevotia lacus DSM 23236]